ncbi:C4-dicarboxylate ABC transporter [Mesorhizobium sp. L-8-10]|uniref:TRAP transporter substrate-binding protein n=1 Tax=Mesorhizobium sp. L-8-10 TaxID=2744523 RepID=UPI0019269D63|nr:TRAP transporter substrate-binding protein [Mesorhizobium sp. L-8-10]BCH31206.1 C4-dicarboxylate ABC transporter [Mesorhizobium sp. L-8-10]
MKALRRLVISALLSLGAAGASQAQEITLRFHSFIHATSYQQIKFFEPWCEKIKGQSAGRMVCQIYPSMQLGGSPAELFNQARDGIVDIVYGNPGYSPGSYLAAEVFELPFMLNDVHNASRAMWDVLGDNPGPEFEGLRLIAIAPSDFPIIQTTSKPIRTVDDLQGVKLRSAGRYGAKVLEALGALPIQMPAGEIVDSLNRGVIDGAYLPWSAVGLLKLNETMKHFTDFGDKQQRMYTSVQIVAMSQATYDRLSDDLKKVIDDNRGVEPSVQFGDAFESTAVADKKAFAEEGADIHVLSDSEYERWRKAAEPITDEWVADANKKGLDGGKLLEQARQAIAKYAN